MTRQDVVKLIDAKLTELKQTVSPQLSPVFDKFCQIVNALTSKLPEQLTFSSEQKSFVTTVLFDENETVAKFAQLCKSWTFTIVNEQILIRLSIIHLATNSKFRFQIQVTQPPTRQPRSRVKISLDDLPNILNL